MREDMFKVIVERPRRLHGNAYKSDGRAYRNREDSPMRLGMQKGYSDKKWLNENLGPLKRYLASQANRPWDKVYSEIRATIDPRHTVKQHILEHLYDFVATRTKWETSGGKGQIMVKGHSWFQRGQYIPLEATDVTLYVHPLSGLLLRNTYFQNRSHKRKQEQSARQLEKLAVRRCISERIQLHCMNGIWYEVRLDELPVPYERLGKAALSGQRSAMRDERWDVLRKQWVKRSIRLTVLNEGNSIDYGCSSLYAMSKRQLNSHELKKYQLTQPASKAKGPNGPFFIDVRLLLTAAKTISAHTAMVCLRLQQSLPIFFAPR